jgi:hypothetical protein
MNMEFSMDAEKDLKDDCEKKKQKERLVKDNYRKNK